MSLYRQYRPQTFADVVGQDHVVTTLERAVAQGKLTHAYLFAGSRGTGKTSVARILAKAMLTQGMTDDTIKRHVIVGVEEGSLVDLVEIDAASNRGIDDIRGLVEKLQFSPVVGSAKVYIIDEVHMLTKEAFNALLKTLEEPPSYAYFILATTELQKIPATIQSRCQRFGFRQVLEEDIIRRLQYIADQERISIDRTALRAIAHHADGSVRDAISLLDQLRTLPAIGMKDIQERIGESGHEYVEQILAAIESKDAQELLSIIRKIESAGLSLETVTRLLLGVTREHLHAAVDAKQLLEPHSRLVSQLLATLRDMRIAPVPGLVLESSLLSLCSEEASTETKTKLLRRKSAEPKRETAPAEETAPAAEATAAKAEVAVIEAPELTVDALREVWPQVLHEVVPASLRMSLKNCHIHGLRGTTVTLAFSSAFHRDKAAKVDAARAVEQLLGARFRTTLRIECTLEEDHVPSAPDKEMVNVAEAAAEVF